MENTGLKELWSKIEVFQSCFDNIKYKKEKKIEIEIKEQEQKAAKNTTGSGRKTHCRKEKTNGCNFK